MHIKENHLRVLMKNFYNQQLQAVKLAAAKKTASVNRMLQVITLISQKMNKIKYKHFILS